MRLERQQHLGGCVDRRRHRHRAELRSFRLRQRQRFGQHAGQLGLELVGLHRRQLPEGQQLEQRVPEQLGLEQQRQQLVSAERFIERKQLLSAERF